MPALLILPFLLFGNLLEKKLLGGKSLIGLLIREFLNYMGQLLGQGLGESSTLMNIKSWVAKDFTNENIRYFRIVNQRLLFHFFSGFAFLGLVLSKGRIPVFNFWYLNLKLGNLVCLEYTSQQKMRLNPQASDGRWLLRYSQLQNLPPRLRRRRSEGGQWKFSRRHRFGVRL